MAENTMARLPIIDLHCDLLVYLSDVPGSDMNNLEAIGCALPALAQGNVKLQVMAIYSPTAAGSTDYALLQSQVFRKIGQECDNCLTPVTDTASLKQALQAKDTIGMVAAVENAAGFCEESDHLDTGFKKLERIIEHVGRLLYISFTHHTPNRFGGGNMSDAGITSDGRVLLEYLHDRQIAVDLSHTSDALAHDILNQIDKAGLRIPILASHSNFRHVWEHPRNLPIELVQEIINRKGLIGMNFLRAFLNTQDPEALPLHILYGFKHGAGDAIAFGADYFYTSDNPDPSRIPYYFKEHEQAGLSYAYVLDRLRHELTPTQLSKITHGNAQRFIQNMWQ